MLVKCLEVRVIVFFVMALGVICTRLNYRIHENPLLKLKDSTGYMKNVYKKELLNDYKNSKAMTRETYLYRQGFVCDQTGLYSVFSGLFIFETNFKWLLRKFGNMASFFTATLK